MNPFTSVKLKKISVHGGVPNKDDKVINADTECVFDEGDGYNSVIIVKMHMKNDDYSFSQFREKAIGQADQILKDVVAQLKGFLSS